MLFICKILLQHLKKNPIFIVVVRIELVLREGYGDFWMFYNSRAYSTKFAHYYWFVITWNLWNFRGIFMIISWDIQILNKQKKHKMQDVSWTVDFFWIGLKIGPDLSISSKNWPANFLKFDSEIYISCQNIKDIFNTYFDAILVRYGNSKICRPIFSSIPKNLMSRKFFEY